MGSPLTVVSPRFPQTTRSSSTVPPHPLEGLGVWKESHQGLDKILSVCRSSGGPRMGTELAQCPPQAAPGSGQLLRAGRVSGGHSLCEALTTCYMLS